MGATSTNLTVTIVTRTVDPEDQDLALEAEIVAADNNGESTYYVSETYYLRLFKSGSISSVSSGCNIGTVSKVSTGLTCSVPYDGEDDEYITFAGSATASLSKIYQSNFSATQVGKVFDINGVATTASLTAPGAGSKTVTANKEIFGVFKVTYTTKYDKWSFNSPSVGPMIIFFIGSGA